jgi:hypothetical protein
MLLAQDEGIATALSFEDIVPALSQDGAREDAHRFVVLDEENGLRAALEAPLLGGRRGRCSDG